MVSVSCATVSAAARWDLMDLSRSPMWLSARPGFTGGTDMAAGHAAARARGSRAGSARGRPDPAPNRDLCSLMNFTSTNVGGRAPQCSYVKLPG